MNTRYSEVVGTLSRALGNTLDRYEDQGDVLVLHIRWPLSHDEKESVKYMIRYLLPGARLTLQKWVITIHQ